MKSKRAAESEANAQAYGLHEVRTARPAHVDLNDPRDPAWDPLIAAYRRRLLARSAEPRLASEQRAAGAHAAPLPGLSEQLASAPYRYSKGPDFTNDGLGYGEALQEPLWWVVEGGIVAETRTSQRTKTGKQLLHAAPLSARVATQPEPAPSASPSPAARTLPEQASQPRRRAL